MCISFKENEKNYSEFSSNLLRLIDTKKLNIDINIY